MNYPSSPCTWFTVLTVLASCITYSKRQTLDLPLIYTCTARRFLEGVVGSHHCLKCKPLGVRLQTKKTNMKAWCSGSAFAQHVRCCWFVAWSGHAELILRIIMLKQKKSICDGASTLVLKPMGRVNWRQSRE